MSTWVQAEVIHYIMLKELEPGPVKKLRIIEASKIEGYGVLLNCELKSGQRIKLHTSRIKDMVTYDALSPTVDLHPDPGLRVVQNKLQQATVFSKRSGFSNHFTPIISELQDYEARLKGGGARIKGKWLSPSSWAELQAERQAEEEKKAEDLKKLRESARIKAEALRLEWERTAPERERLQAEAEKLAEEKREAEAQRQKMIYEAKQESVRKLHEEIAAGKKLTVNGWAKLAKTMTIEEMKEILGMPDSRSVRRCTWPLVFDSEAECDVWYNRVDDGTKSGESLYLGQAVEALYLLEKAGISTKPYFERYHVILVPNKPSHQPNFNFIDMRFYDALKLLIKKSQSE